MAWEMRRFGDGVHPPQASIVLVSGLADIIMATICENLHLGFVWPGLVLPMVLAWYIITEIGSILENAISLGAKVPSWLVKLMKAGLKAVDAARRKSSAGRERINKEIPRCSNFFWQRGIFGYAGQITPCITVFHYSFHYSFAFGKL